MSSPKRKRTAILSPAARADFTDILLYTWQQWGEEQRDRYQATLEQAIAALADFPAAGVRLPRLCAGCRARRIGSHVLYYRIMDDTIEVVRILHERSDPTRHLHESE
jgi:toxin ParE1/3/4